MPRQARKKSYTNYFHVIVRGVGKQVLFETQKDYKYYISLMKEYAADTGVVINAFCLMENHVHMLVRDEDGELALFMKKMGISYASYYNTKYDRTGHLFQDRYLSESVESESYLFNVFRYILNNPSKAGICSAARYPWNSYGMYGNKKAFVDTAIFETRFGNWERYAAFIREKNDDCCMEYTSKKKDENWIRDKIRDILGVESGTAILTYESARRNDAIRKLKDSGLSIRQIARMTGVGRSIVARA